MLFRFARLFSSAPTRVVITHSQTSYVDGLIDMLRSLTATTATTATPGRLTGTKGSVPHLTVSVTVPIMGGFKAIAKRGSLCQEVFFTTALEDAAALQRALDARLAEGRATRRA